LGGDGSALGRLFLLVIPAKAGIHFDLSVQVRGFVSPAASRLLFVIAQSSHKKQPKRLGTGRGVSPRIVRGKFPCASRRGAAAQTVRPCTAMLGTANGAIDPRIRPSMDYVGLRHKNAQHT
jgi:hypothetical protein